MQKLSVFPNVYYLYLSLLEWHLEIVTLFYFSKDQKSESQLSQNILLFSFLKRAKKEAYFDFPKIPVEKESWEIVVTYFHNSFFINEPVRPFAAKYVTVSLHNCSEVPDIVEEVCDSAPLCGEVCDGVAA